MPLTLAVHVKPGAHRDQLWRDTHGLVVHIRAVPAGGQANDYLIRYLSGSLRVAQSLITITGGHTSRHKRITIQVPEVDLQPILDTLPPAPQTTLFSDA